MTSRAVLVTGGAGYIGSHACKALNNSGYLPIAVDNLSQGHCSLAKWGPLEVGDVRNRAWLCSVIERYAVKSIIHFAALTSSEQSIKDPLPYFDNNVGGTISVLRAAAHADIRHVVFSSTCAVYGNPDKLPLTEDAPTDPVSPYGETKLFCETLLQRLDAAGDLRFISLRYFNAAGADPDGETGELHDPETHLIPRLIQAALTASGAVEIFGLDHATPDGSAIRDYVHVTDLAEAHVSALEYLLNGGNSAIFNLGSGRGHSVLEVLSAVERVTRSKLATTPRPARAGDAAMLYADTARARASLGFATRFSDLDTILETAAAWQRAHFKAACPQD